MSLVASNFTKRISLLVFSLLFLSACNGSEITITPSLPASQEGKTPQVDTTVSSEPITQPTTDPSTPLAAIVNGQVIPLTEFQAELERARTASETGLSTYTEDDVLQNMIDEVLLAQGAAEAGFLPDETVIQTRLKQLNMDEQTLQGWLRVNNYTQENFEHAFSRAIAAAWMRDQIISRVSSTADQVHARQILLYNSDEAENAYAQLQAGTDFATLAVQYDPLASGELGWFPRGYLTVPKLDEPIFSLQPGEYTQIIETFLGFHIVQVIERDSERSLSPGAFQSKQIQAVEKWIVERRSQSDIQIFLS